MLLAPSAVHGALPSTARDKFFGFCEVFVSRKEDGMKAASTTTSSASASASTGTSTSSDPAVKSIMAKLDLPRRFDRRYTVNFAVRLGPAAEQNRGKGPLIRNEAEAAHEAREELRQAARAGSQAARSTGAEDRQLLQDFLNSAAAGQAGALAEVKGLANQYLDFQTRRNFR